MNINEYKNQTLACALAYAKRGLRVFPVHSYIDGICTCDNPQCGDPAKHPLNYNGCIGATTDVELIKAWHSETDGLCNWGIATGEASGVWVLDGDPRHSGDKTLADLESRHGPLPVTSTVATGGCGKHYFFRWAEGVKSRAAILPGLDVRGEGGYVVAPPSLHASGNHYSWLTPMDTPLADAPAWLLALVRDEKQDAPCSRPQAKSIGVGLSEKPEALAVSVDKGPGLTLTVSPSTADLTNSPGVGDGSRNATIAKRIGVHIARGDGLGKVEALALAWAAKCNPPLEEAKALDHVHRLWRKHHAKAGASTENDTQHTPDAGPEAGREGLNSATASRPGPGISSLPPQAPASESGGGVVSVDTPAWPTLHADALYGLAGEIVRVIGPETEADLMGVLVCLLTAIGNAVGRGPHFTVGARRHYPSLFTALVGETSAAKGEALAVAHYLLAKADPTWAEQCIARGFGSGEGLVWRVRDAQEKQEPVKSKGVVTGFRTVLIPGGADKRALFVETEFSKVIRLMRRENSTLSEMARRAWDGDVLEFANKGENAYKATDAHISIVAHVTPVALANAQGKGSEDKDGTFSRFLWCLVRSQKDLPGGGNIAVLNRFVKPVADAIANAKAFGEVRRTSEAEALWESVYPGLKRSGDSIPCTEKARPLVMRLALLYALQDMSGSIGVKHLKAALAIWHYAETSARLIFGGGLTAPATAEPLAVRLLNAITASPGISRTGLRDVAGHKEPAEEIEKRLSWLEAKGLAHRGECGGGPGRKAECWWPGPKPEPGAESNEREAEAGGSTDTKRQSPANADAGGREQMPAPARSCRVRFPPSLPRRQSHAKGRAKGLSN